MAELRAIYRLQLTSDFGFAAARSLVPYLRDLGISHLYLSPVYQARPGSTHGYDVTDPRRLSGALGGQEEFERLAGAAHDAGMGLVLDVVPNHMATDDANRYWADDVLREKFFDVDRSHAWVLTRRIAHSAHHRGQLTVYLRLWGEALYSTYGPTADTGGLAANGARVIYRRGSVDDEKLPIASDKPLTERPDRT